MILDVIHAHTGELPGLIARFNDLLIQDTQENSPQVPYDIHISIQYHTYLKKHVIFIWRMHTPQTRMMTPDPSLRNSGENLTAKEARLVAVLTLPTLLRNSLQLSTLGRPRTFLTNSQTFADNIASAYEELGFTLPIRV
jgi:hypothetical protein